VMPGINGLETITILRQDAPEISIIAMSGYAAGSGLAEDDFFRIAMERGATCCLSKPFTREQLLDAVEFCRLSRSMVALTPRWPRAERIMNPCAANPGPSLSAILPTDCYPFRPKNHPIAISTMPTAPAANPCFMRGRARLASKPGMNDGSESAGTRM